MRGVSLCSWILGASAGITYARFLPNSEYALIGGLSQHLAMYEVKTGVKKKKYVGVANNSFPLVHSYGKVGTKGYYIFGASESDEVKIWNMASEAVEGTIRIPKESSEDIDSFAACVDYNEATQRLAVCGPNSKNAAYLYQIQ